MAGTIPLALTQQFSALGKPLTGGKLYIFQTATTTPQSAYSNSGLTTSLPNPLTLDSSGRVPPFFLADGTIKVRLTDKNGVIQAEWDNLLVLGPSSGSGGGGSTVDATTIFQTGFPLFLEQAGVLSGFIRDNGRTIGNAVSGATERANADCSALFTWYWGGFSDTLCPVSGGRGVSAAADFAANKSITVLDKRAVSAIGLDDMGNSAASRFTNVPFTSGNATTAGSICGENAHQLTTPELASHSHSAGSLVPNPSSLVTSANSIASPDGPAAVNRLISVNNSGVGIIGSTANAGSDGLHNTVQRSITGSWYRKL